MNRILALGFVTFKEGIRSRSLLGVLVLFLFVCGLNLAAAGFFMRDVGKVTVDMNLSAMNFVGLLLVLFLGLNLTAKDIEKKTIQLILTRPISRFEYAWGKYLGIELFLAASLLFLLLLSICNIALVKHYYPTGFEGFVWGSFLWAWVFGFLKLSVLNALVLLFGALATSSFMTLVFSIGTYVVGTTIEEVLLYLDTALATDVVSPSSHRFFELIGYLVPNLSAFDLQLAAAHGLPVAAGQITLAFFYASAYIAVAVTLAALALLRREFN